MPVYELGAAFVCSSLISPIMVVLDTSIIRSQFEKINLKRSCTETIRGYRNGSVPFLRPLTIMNGVYFSTYASANLTELYCKEKGVDSRLPTLGTTSLVNIVGITLKDRAFIQMFEKQTFHFPWRSYALFGLRDSLTIASTFVVKKDLVHLLHHDYGVGYTTADFVSSFTIPVLAQLVSTPIHILSLDYYQRPNVSARDRMRHIAHLYTAVCSGRMLRIVPAFCLGSFLNDVLRSRRYFVD